MTAEGREGALPTLEDVARLAGVSRATVSRVVNGSPLVTADTRSSVTQAIEQLGYRPNSAARSLVTRRVGAVAVAVPEADERVFSDPFFPQTYHGALTAFAGQDVQVLLAIAQPGESVARMVRYLDSGLVDGALVVSHHGPHLATALRTGTRPIVFVGNPGIEGFPYVDLNQHQGAVLATRHLVERGASRIATITGPMDMTAAVDRLRGFEDGLHEAHLSSYGAADGGFTVGGGAEAASSLLAAHPDIDGLFVANDLMAQGALRILARAGRRVPEDVKVVGFDNSVVATELDPPLTTMSNPASEMARIAGTMLLTMLAGGQPPAPVILDSVLIERSST
jgi:DNA-binding LacI/PurR family transcriptional regulator